MKHNWEYKRLGDICDLYQPKTIAASELVEDGEYDVYGANGIIGKFTRYNHEFPEILLTCRGATCGTINISNPKSWINGNAMVIHSKSSELLFAYLKYAMTALDYSNIITGAAQPQITRQSLAPTNIPLPPMVVQEHIVAELDKINDVIEDCRELLRNLDALAQSLFYDFFGDPVTNPKGWEIKKLDEICRAISTGITYKPDNVADIGTIVLRSSNIQNSSFVLDDIVHIDMSLKPSQYVQKNDILMCSRNGSARLVGKVALIPQLNEKMSWGAFMTIIRSDYYHYLFQFFRLPAFREQLTKTKTTTVNQITIGMLKKIQIPMPPLSLQEQFASRIEQIEAQKKAVEETIENLQTLLDSRMDYWFN